MSTYENRHDFRYGARLNNQVARQLAPMSDDQIRKLAPSVFAAEPHGSRSERYAYIPTSIVLAGLRKEGFIPVSAQQSRSRTPGKAEYTKHLMKFIRADGAVARVGDAIPEVVLINSHDGTSAYKIYLGCFRYVCSNGLIVCDSLFDSVSIPHTGNVQDEVIDASFEVIDAGKKIGQTIEQWQGITLQTDEARAFAKSAHLLRWDGEDAKAPTEVTPDRLLAVRRPGDLRTDLWTTFNRVQENIVKGGQEYVLPPARGQFRRRNLKVRPVAGIDQNTALNRALWQLGDEMRKLKSGGNA